MQSAGLALLVFLYQLRLGASASQVGSSSGVAEALALVKKLEEQLLQKQAQETSTAEASPAAKRAPERPLPAPPAAAAALALPPMPDVSEDEDDDDRSAEASLVAPPAMWAAEESDDYG